MKVLELKKDNNAGESKTGLDVMEKIKEMIRDQYPGMSELHAEKLAVLLAKEGLKERTK